MAEKPVDVLPALLDLSRWLRRDRIPFVIIGGTAVGFVGRPRTTKDVDAMVLLGEHTWESFAARAAKMGFLPRSRDMVAFARQNRVFLLRHALSGVEIDISAGALPFEKDSIRRAHLVSIEGTKVPVASPEDLIVMKILASRPRDLGDIEGILATNPKLDRRRVRRLVRQFSEVLEMPELIDRLEELFGRRRR
jgi:predicted nucleotidyltransferase